MQKNNIQNMVLYSMLIALALVLSYVEMLIPLSFAIPGIKLGLANLVVIVAIYILNIRAAAIISFVRIVLVANTFGNMAALMFAISGASLSLIFMIIAIKIDKFSVLGISIIGGIMHNVGQILMAVLILKNVLIFSYLPYLMIAGLICGLLIGLLAALVLKRIKYKTDK